MKNVEQSLKSHVAFGALAFASLVGGFGAWAGLTNLSGAVVASGVVVVEGQIKKIQHPTGGVVTSILVKDGMLVNVGDVLLKLDETVLNATAQIYMKQMDESKIRIARLEAEQNEAVSFLLPQEFTSRQNEPEIKTIFANETALFTSRISTLNSQKTQLNERITQTNEEIHGLSALKASRENELSLISRELKSVSELEKKGYALLSRLIALKRDHSRMNGEVLNITAEIAKTKSRMLEAQTQLSRMVQETQRDRSTEIRDTKSKLNEANERAIAAKDSLQRAEIRAPHAGVVHQLVANSVGGVIAPNEVIMSLVPANENLIIEAKVQQSDIDQVVLGEKALLRFPALNQRTTPELLGKVTHISADISKEKDYNPMQQMPYYTARISLDKVQLARLNGASLVPGMAVESFIHTSERSAMSYFVKPLTDQMARAFKER